MRNILFGENGQKELELRGYTKGPLLSEEHKAYLLRELQVLAHGDNFASDESGTYGFTFHCTFLDTNVDYKRRAQHLIREVFSSYVERSLDGYEILTGNFFIKAPGTGQLMVHRNFSFLEDINDTTVTLWCPLVDVDESNGTIQVVEGSHNVVRQITTPTVAPFFQHFENEIIGKYSKPILLKAGEGLIFDDNVLHGSAKNNSNAPRYVVQMVCVPKDRQCVVYYLDHTAKDNRFELFAINSDFFIDNTLTDLLTRPKHLQSLGFVENKNRMLSEKQFVALLKRGNEVKSDNKQARKQSKRLSFLNRIRSLLKPLHS